MIVVDCNILAYLHLPSEFSEQTERLLAQEPHWVAPVLWRSEFRSVLALYLRKNMLTLEQAYAIQTSAETLLAGAEYEVPSLEVLRLVANSGCTAYDCEFVALARQLNVKLVTADKQMLREFPEIALSMSQVLA